MGRVLVEDLQTQLRVEVSQLVGVRGAQGRAHIAERVDPRLDLGVADHVRDGGSVEFSLRHRPLSLRMMDRLDHRCRIHPGLDRVPQPPEPCLGVLVSLATPLRCSPRGGVAPCRG